MTFAFITSSACPLQDVLPCRLFCAVDITVSCSYVYTDGKLASVPASRAAVFRDRTLGPMDKRLLTRFLMQLGSSLQDNPFPQVHSTRIYTLADACCP